MFVRMARFEGGDPNEADQAIERVRQLTEGEPPPGLEGAKRLLMLIDRQQGRGLGLTFFESEDEMRRGDEALNAMSSQSSGQRTSVEMYEVGLDRDF
ncbi:MAG: hypothetical protein ABI896_06055 [Actinomycetota bacterium]